jgi:hypothetical protein
MNPYADPIKRHSELLSCLLSFFAIGLILAIMIFLNGCGHVPQAGVQQSFSTPEAAVDAMIEALEINDVEQLSIIFGPGSDDLVTSGDPAADRIRRKQFVQFFEEKNRLEKITEDRVILHIGDEDWPFPIPLIKADKDWQFDTEEGRDEIIARRIGRNELITIQVCLAYVDAQREYAMMDHDGDGFLEYARQFRSDPGKQNGLYWPETEGNPLSPLGPLLVAAESKGYDLFEKNEEPDPFYGYYYRILDAQGKNAGGGAYEYVINGKMIGGFALIAYPADYGASGVMTFMVNHEEVVYQKDLGEQTEKTVQEINLFDPDETWSKVDAVATYIWNQ